MYRSLIFPKFGLRVIMLFWASTLIHGADVDEKFRLLEPNWGLNLYSIQLGISVPKNIYEIGEAIPITVVVENGNTNDISLSLLSGENYRANAFRLVAVSLDGGKAREKPLPFSGSQKWITIRAGERYESTCNANQDLEFLSPGLFSIYAKRVITLSAGPIEFRTGNVVIKISDSQGTPSQSRPDTSGVPIDTVTYKTLSTSVYINPQDVEAASKPQPVNRRLRAPKVLASTPPVEPTPTDSVSLISKPDALPEPTPITYLWWLALVCCALIGYVLLRARRRNAVKR